MEKVTVNREQKLYVIPHVDGYTCQGFDNADRQARLVAAWLGKPDLIPTARKGTIKHYYQCHDTLMAGFAYHDDTGERCEAELTPELTGLEGKRVEVIDCDGNRRRFQVGKSTGWLPCHLEINNARSTGGPAVYGAPFKSVRVIR